MEKEIISGMERENRIQIVNCLPEQIQEIRKKYNFDNSIKGIHLNIRNIEKNKELLQTTLKDISIDLDFKALTETWVTEKQVGRVEVTLEGYDIIWSSKNSIGMEESH